MESAKVFHVKKAKKKQVKDELDRIKQAEKKRRRLEKALATSAAIRSELEKKKQKKKEEEQRLDEEGAAIAEAVALHVLLGEDSDDTSRIVLKKHENFDEWHGAGNIGLFMDSSALCHQNLRRCSFESGGCFSSDFGHVTDWNHFGGSNQPLSSGPLEDLHFPCSWGGAWNPNDISAGLIAAQAVSSLQIGEEAQVDAVFFNRY